MDVFGAHWERHFARICADWRARVRDEDIVLMPGDLSWAMQLSDAVGHIELVSALPGRKILLKGNHDYWWSSISRLRDVLPPNMYAIQNDAIYLDGCLFAGTRGWVPPEAQADDNDRRVYARECVRLQLSLKAARALSEDAPMYVMTHYPPCTRQMTDTPFTRMMEEYRAACVVYGHLHGPAIAGAFTGTLHDIPYHLVSCDALDCKLFRIH